MMKLSTRKRIKPEPWGMPVEKIWGMPVEKTVQSILFGSDHLCNCKSSYKGSHQD